jgi:H+/Cl- antiporter ClcA
MACGLATGLAVAFDAPIVGVLLALEGSVAFLTSTAILRIFACAMLGAFFSRW